MRPTRRLQGSRLRRQLDATADEPGRPIALDLAASLPHLHGRPPGELVASIAGAFERANYSMTLASHPAPSR